MTRRRARSGGCGRWLGEGEKDGEGWLGSTTVVCILGKMAFYDEKNERGIRDGRTVELSSSFGFEKAFLEKHAASSTEVAGKRLAQLI